MKFLDLFEPIQKGDFGLTDEAVYKSIQYDEGFVPLWGGEQEHTTEEKFVSVKGRTKHNESIRIFEGSGIILSLDGSAGRMTFVKNKKFALNHHAGFFKTKNESKELINPEFFSLFLEKQLQEASVSEGSKTLTTQQIYEMDFDIPPYLIQERLMERLKPILEKKKQIEDSLKRVRTLKRRIFASDYSSYQAKEVSIEKIVQCQSGNSGLTQEYIYSQIQDKSLPAYRLLTASINFNKPEFVSKFRHPKNSLRNIVTIDGKDVIHVVRNGVYAGTASYFEKGNYTTNDHAYLLYLRKDLPWKIDLQWLLYSLRPYFFSYLSSSDNKTWNKTAFFENVTVDLPEYNEQLEVTDIYKRIEKVESEMMEALATTSSLFEKQISI